jgi:hypothetical protein
VYDMAQSEMAAPFFCHPAQKMRHIYPCNWVPAQAYFAALTGAGDSP